LVIKSASGFTITVLLLAVVIKACTVTLTLPLSAILRVPLPVQKLSPDRKGKGRVQTVTPLKRTDKITEALEVAAVMEPLIANVPAALNVKIVEIPVKAKLMLSTLLFVLMVAENVSP
jgi:hypothetical protein